MKKTAKSTVKPKRKQPEANGIWLVSVGQLAYLFGVTERTVNDWTRKKGCPKISHGNFDLKAVFDWWMESDMAAVRVDDSSSDIQAVKLDYWRWKTENERMKAQQTKDELVPRSEIATHWSSRVLEIGTGLYALANRLPPLLEGKALREMSATIRGEVRKLHESYSRTGRFCVVENQIKPAKRKTA